VLAVGEESLRQWSAGAVAALDRPDPLPPLRHGVPHRVVPGLVGAEPAGRQHRLVIVDDSMVADSWWGSTPMNSFPIATAIASPM